MRCLPSAQGDEMRVGKEGAALWKLTMFGVWICIAGGTLESTPVSDGSQLSIVGGKEKGNDRKEKGNVA